MAHKKLTLPLKFACLAIALLTGARNGNGSGMMFFTVLRNVSGKSYEPDLTVYGR